MAKTAVENGSPHSNLKPLKNRNLSSLTTQKKFLFPENLTRLGMTYRRPDQSLLGRSQCFRPRIGVRRTLICDDTCNKEACAEAAEQIVRCLGYLVICLTLRYNEEVQSGYSVLTLTKAQLHPTHRNKSSLPWKMSCVQNDLEFVVTCLFHAP